MILWKVLITMWYLWEAKNDIRFQRKDWSRVLGRYIMRWRHTSLLTRFRYKPTLPITTTYIRVLLPLSKVHILSPADQIVASHTPTSNNFSTQASAPGSLQCRNHGHTNTTNAIRWGSNGRQILGPHSRTATGCQMLH